MQQHRGTVHIKKKSKCVLIRKTNTDIHRVPRTINSKTRSNYVQHHVKAHQDKYIIFVDLSYETQLNCYCDSLTKQVIKLHWVNVVEVVEEEDTGMNHRHPLPLELVRVFINGVKKQLTSERTLTSLPLSWFLREFEARLRRNLSQLLTSVRWDSYSKTTILSTRGRDDFKSSL